MICYIIDENLGGIVMEKQKKKETYIFEDYYDGIPEEYYKLSPEELKESIKEEERKTKELSNNR